MKFSAQNIKILLIGSHPISMQFFEEEPVCRIPNTLLSIIYMTNKVPLNTKSETINFLCHVPQFTHKLFVAI